MHFGLIETQSNQAYVFSTNREKAIRGASELLFRSTTDWVIDAVTGERASRSLAERAAFLRSQDLRGDGVSVVVATSGRAVIVGSNRAQLEEVISNVTARALREAPGLLIAGAVVEFDIGVATGFDLAFHEARSRLSSNIVSLESRLGRSAILPFLRQCPETGIAASESDRAKGTSVSYQFHAQSTATDTSRARLESLAGDNFAASVDDVVEGVNWRAVVHADGNGIGRIFGSLSSILAGHSSDSAAQNLHQIEGYRDFSLALEAATEAALVEATASLSDGKVMPILLGGDDIVVQVSAHRAVDFASAYLSAFEKHSAEAARVLESFATEGAELPDRFTSCAGVSIVKAHFPFSTASKIAGELLDSAKSAKNDGRDSVLDVHVSYDSTAADLATIRLLRQSSDGLKLWGGPYVVADEKSDEARSIADLRSALAALDSAEARSQIQQMKEAARRGRSELDAATSNAVHVAGSNSSRLSSIKTLAREIDGHLLLIDAIELADVARKAGAK